MRRFLTALVSAVGALALLPSLARAHAERPTLSPQRQECSADQLDRKRTPSLVLDVCKIGGDCYRNIQAAVNAAPDNTLIRVWPGFYKELPSRAGAEPPADNADGTFSYEYQVANPSSQNLIAILGKKNITIRGMGKKPEDVVVDAKFKKHVGIRGDRSDGLIIENISFWHSFDHGVYVLDTNCFILDRVHSYYSREYPFLTFANDHGRMTDCEAVGGGDGGIYPGGNADTPGRCSMVIEKSRSHHNVLGYSGTQGDHVCVRNSEFYDNALGLVSDSESNHPNYPENNLTVEASFFYDNNFNVYSADSDVAPKSFGTGAQSGAILIPVGIGIFLASGNDNLVQQNDIWGQNRFGVWLASGEALVSGPTSTPAAVPFVSSGNRFIENRMYAPFPFSTKPSFADQFTGVFTASTGQNLVDFAWDGMGYDNCWQDNVRTLPSTPANSDYPNNDPIFLPPCAIPMLGGPMPITLGIPNLPDLLAQAALSFEGNPKQPSMVPTPLCTQLGQQPPDCVYGPGPAPGKGRNIPDDPGNGFSGMPYPANRPPLPTACGPNTCP